ncbi:hypothetical protein BGZ94_008971 [Podila epigama]|nr:hypothetical protein BGZ94_008971 [Podila epigama]
MTQPSPSSTQESRCHHFFDLPAELQLMTMGNLDLANIHKSKLISKQFLDLANDDQLWRILYMNAEIPAHILRDARQVCGTQATWQTLYRSSILIMRENERLVQNAFAQIKSKIELVREALERQTTVLNQTHSRLERLASRLTLMEEQSRVRDLERLREQQRQQHHIEDSRWCREWDVCQAQLLLQSQQEEQGQSEPQSHDHGQRQGQHHPQDSNSNSNTNNDNNTNDFANEPTKWLAQELQDDATSLVSLSKTLLSSLPSSSPSSPSSSSLSPLSSALSYSDSDNCIPSLTAPVRHHSNKGKGPMI